LLDAYSRRHEAQKIYLRQTAVQSWIGWRESTLNGERPHTGHREGLERCDAALRAVSLLTLILSHITKEKMPIEVSSHGLVLINHLQELAAITDDSIYSDMRSSDYQMGRWTLEDPSLRQIQRWVRDRR